MVKLNDLRKDVRVAVKQLVDEGWVIKRCKKHLILNRNSNTLVISKSPSDVRALRNALRDAVAFS